jgi:hypothetical protein
MTDDKKSQRVFSASEIKHGIALFSDEELNTIENLIIERGEKVEEVTENNIYRYFLDSYVVCSRISSISD